MGLTLNDLLPGLERLEGTLTLKVGVLEGATNMETGEPVADYAMANEYGASGRNIPARPAIRATFDARGDEWADGLGNLLLSGITGESPLDPEAALEVTGMMMAGDIQMAIRDWTTPPNSAATIARKGQDNPLMDTQAYYRSIGVDVAKGNA